MVIWLDERHFRNNRLPILSSQPDLQFRIDLMFPELYIRHRNVLLERRRRDTGSYSANRAFGAVFCI